ncbi:hypothetical protein GQ44DRAFT_723504 [Phaeosphaeriaceae sp. PMI808]|nr:hypothetical protein GQ44DRAFT_723504 [Phaeosphaeriaceae sp. PMI808]
MAAEDTKGKKRKGASEAAPKAKKPRKSDDVAVAAKPAKTPKPAKKKAAQKEAADVLSDVEAIQEEVKATKSKKKSKKEDKVADAEEEPVAKAPKEKTKALPKSKQAKTAPVEEDVVVEAHAETAIKKTKKAKSSKKQVEPEEEITQVEAVVDEVEGEVDEDDQTAALLAGFESDDEETDPEDDEDFKEDVAVPKLTKKQQIALAKAAIGAKSNEPGVIYVGRVPRGFFESEMKKYFSQFGKVKRLRLSRNKKTGASKHYAFVEFASTEVADIVARTMDNYLLFGHILKCKLVPSEQVHPDLFSGGGGRFKVEPRNKKAGLQMERGVERAQWEKRVENENKRRSGRNKHLEEDFGYTYTVPILKGVDAVPKQLQDSEPQQLVEAPVEEQPKGKKNKKAPKVNDDPQPAETAEPVTEKKAKKATKAKIAVEAELQAEIAADVAEAATKKSKKDKKRKSDVVLESSAIVEEPAPKPKKAKKEAKPAIDDEPAAGKKRAAKAEQDVAKPKKVKKAKV